MGRNFNYAIKKGDILYDIGNLIIIENKEGKLGVELALGTSTILKSFFSLSHVNSVNPVFGIEKLIILYNLSLRMQLLLPQFYFLKD